MIKVMLGLMLFTSLTVATYANVARTVIVYSNTFLKSYDQPHDGMSVTMREINKLNTSLKVQGADIYFDVVGHEQVRLSRASSPSDLCLGFVGDEHLMIKANTKFARLNEFRHKYRADVVILMTAFNNEYFRSYENYGIACDPLHNGSFLSYINSDPSYLIIDKLGLETLTLVHEAGHFLGLEHYYVRLDDGAASLMVGNGNGENLERVNVWSDNSHSIFETNGSFVTLPEILSDIDMINKNAKAASFAYERWLEQQAL